MVKKLKTNLKISLRWSIELINQFAYYVALKVLLTNNVTSRNYRGIPKWGGRGGGGGLFSVTVNHYCFWKELNKI